MFGVQTILSTLVLAAIPSSQEATLLFVTSPGCVPCRQAAPLVQELSRQGYSVEVVDAAKHPDLVRRLGVQQFPSFLMVSGDKVVEQVVGGSDPTVLKPKILKMFDDAARHHKKNAGQSDIPHRSLSSPPTPGVVSETVVSPGVESTPFPPIASAHGTASDIVPAAWTAADHAPAGNSASGNSAIAPVSFVSQAGAASRVLPPSSVFPVAEPSNGSSGSPNTEIFPWIQSSVKLRVDAENTHSWGTGTIIDTRDGEALILTCGHIFRDSKGKGQIETHLFGQRSTVKVYGRCLYYDLEIDLALVIIRPPCPVRAIPIAPVDYQVRTDRQVLSVGCDGGANPTVRAHRIMSTDRIGTPTDNAVPFHYIQVSGAPVSGRSGGGLFSEDGYLIGVCNTADPVENDGHFVPPHVIRQVLKSQRLDMILDHPSLGDSREWGADAASTISETFVAVPETLRPLAPVSHQPLPIPATPAERNSHEIPAGFSIPNVNGSPGISDADQATLDEIKRKMQDGDEVILIVKSRRNPELPSDVIFLNGNTDRFFDSLTRRPETQGNPSYNPVILSSHETPGNAPPVRPAGHGPIPASGPQTVSFPVPHQ